MRTRVFSAVFALALMIVLVGAASGQTPYMAVYFDQYHTQETKDCPGFVIDTWYVAAVNFNTFITGADFAIQYPPAVLWIADLNLPPVVIGNTLTGISMGWALPKNGYGVFEMCRVQVLWNCDHCADPYLDNLVRVIPNPMTGFLGVTDFPNFNLVPGIGLTTVICPRTIPTEDTTWGQVKALYGE